jgi:heptosyltransferase-2
LTTPGQGTKMRNMKILIRAPNWIGDCVMAGPAVTSLKNNFPQAEIWIAARDWVAGLFNYFEGVSGILPLPSSTPGIKGLKGAAGLREKDRFDAGLLLTNSFHSALLFARAKIPQRWGYRTDGRGLFLTRSVRRRSRDVPAHHVTYYLDLLDGLGFKTLPPRLSLPRPQQETALMRERLSRKGWDEAVPLVLLNPGAQYGPSKRWPAERFRAVARRITGERDVFLAISGSAADIPLAEEIAEGLNPKPVILAGKTSLEELLAVIGLTRLFVTNDSGPMHIANALGTPLVALFGPTDHRATGPFQQPSALVRHEAACWPCLNRVCPFDHRCMLDISPDEVLKTCLDLLDNNQTHD